MVVSKRTLNLFAFVSSSSFPPPYWKKFKMSAINIRCSKRTGACFRRLALVAGVPSLTSGLFFHQFPPGPSISTMSLLHYITYKLVVIRDRRIGSIYYAIAVLIVLYTLAQIFLKKGYLEVLFSFFSFMSFIIYSITFYTVLMHMLWFSYVTILD